MKQIRKGIFETNSSSTHTLTIMSKSEYDEWNEKLQSGDYYVDYDYELHSKKELEKEFEEYKKKWNKESADFEDWRKNEYFTSEEFDDYIGESYEFFYHEKEVEGKQIVVMGYHGYNG